MATSGIDLGIQGVIEARARWESAHRLANGDRFTIAVAEAIMWATAVDEICWDQKPYLSYRDASQGGRILDGLRWARNQGVHRCIAAHGTGLGYGYPVRRPTPDQFEARWLPRLELPVEAKMIQRNRAAYDANVAGEDVRLSLYAVEDFLTRQGFADATTGEL